MIKKLSLTLSGTALLAAMTFSPLANANTSANQSQSVAPTTQAAPAETFSDADLNLYIAAADQVNRINNEYSPKVAAADTDADKRILAQQADQDMVRAVRAEGMSVEKFVEINNAVQADPALAQRVTKMMQ